jgi:hypothetical protein
MGLKMWKEAVVTEFKVPSWHLPRGAWNLYRFLTNPRFQKICLNAFDELVPVFQVEAVSKRVSKKHDNSSSDQTVTWHNRPMLHECKWTYFVPFELGVLAWVWPWVKRVLNGRMISTVIVATMYSEIIVAALWSSNVLGLLYCNSVPQQCLLFTSLLKALQNWAGPCDIRHSRLSVKST